MLNPIEEAKYQELKEKCRELRVPPLPDIFIGLKVHDRNGILVFDDVQRGHSWSRALWNMACYYLSGAPQTASTFGAGYLTGKNTGGSVVNGIYNNATIQAMGGAIGVATQGIVVGTGDTAFSVEQFALAAIIPHGGTAGTFAYAANGTPVAAYTAGTKTWKNTVSRIFNNNSGGSITVKETGLYGYNGSGGTSMVERSVLSPTVAVANAAQLTVTYEISMDFSAID